MFALAGVALQQTFTYLADKRRTRTERVRALQAHRVSLYTQMIANARRVQRALKDSSVAQGGTGPAEERLKGELERLAESVAAVRLFSSAQTSKAAERFEDVARSVSRRPPSERSEPVGDLRLGSLIETLKEELGPH